jgi:hypothetical protein
MNRDQNWNKKQIRRKSQISWRVKLKRKITLTKRQKKNQKSMNQIRKK